MPSVKKGPRKAVALLFALVLCLGITANLDAAERNFLATDERNLVEAAIKFLEDNGSESISGKTALEELKEMLAADAPDGMKRIRRETSYGLGEGEAFPGGKIVLGLPASGINTDLNTPEGFKQVKTVAQTLYHEWVHYRRFQEFGMFLIPALDQNWAACQPLWDEVEAYYLEIKHKLAWQLAREQELADIPGFGPIHGPSTQEQQQRGEQLTREIADLKGQIKETTGTEYLAGKRPVSPGSNYQKSYEEGGNLLKDTFYPASGSELSTRQKYDEVSQRLNDVSRILRGEASINIEEKIRAKVNSYFDQFLEKAIKTIETSRPPIRLIVTLKGEDGKIIEVTIPEGGIHGKEDREYEFEIIRLKEHYMAPWQELGSNVLSPVYQVSAPLEIMANPDKPARIKLSFDSAALVQGTPHIYQLRTSSRGRGEAGPASSPWERLEGTEIDFSAGIIEAACANPFSLFVVMETPRTQTLGDLDIGDKVVDPTWEWEHRRGNNYTGTGETKPITWIVVARGQYGEGSGVTLLAEELIGRYTFDDSTDVHPGGSNHWGESGMHSTSARGLRPWLNSTGMHDGEGFFQAMSQNFRNAILDTGIPNRAWQSGEGYPTTDKVFIPSTTELGDTTHTDTFEIGKPFPYFSAVGAATPRATLHDDYSHYWTRSPNPVSADTVLIVTPYGEQTFARYQARSGDTAVRPAVNLRSETRVATELNSDGSFEFSWWDSYPEDPGLRKFDLTVSLAGVGITEPAPGRHEYYVGREITLAATPSTGWLFEKWVVDGEEYREAAITINMDRAVSAMAYFRYDQNTWDKWPGQTTNDPAKEWNIKFNKPYNPGSVTTDTVYITNNTWSKMPLNYYHLPDEDDNSFVLRVSLQQDDQDLLNNYYIPGEDYYLWIQGVVAADGTILKNNVMMKFTMMDGE